MEYKLKKMATIRYDYHRKDRDVSKLRDLDSYITVDGKQVKISDYIQNDPYLRPLALDPHGDHKVYAGTHLNVGEMSEEDRKKLEGVYQELTDHRRDSYGYTFSKIGDNLSELWHKFLDKNPAVDTYCRKMGDLDPYYVAGTAATITLAGLGLRWAVKKWREFKKANGAENIPEAKQ